MNLKDILKQVKTESKITRNADVLDGLKISDIEIDSRRVTKNSIFFALSGKSTNGAKFIDVAIKNGAVAVVSDDFSFCNNDILKDIVTIKSTNSFSLLVEALNILHPSLPDNIYAVTGTNGKTTIAGFGRQILKFLGKKSASIGTLGVISDDINQSDLQKSNLTTPDIVSFYKNLAVLKKNGVDDVFIETSSIGLDQKRIEGLKIEVGAFTNFTQDHLDYHSSMRDYFKCKMQLFSKVLEEGSLAVLNRDIPQYAKILEICQKRNHKILTYGFKKSDFRIYDIKGQDLHQEITFEYQGNRYAMDLNMVGEFQAYNILCAIAMIFPKHEISSDGLSALVKNFSKIKSACGRMQKVATLENKEQDKAQIFIDFAHSSDALENVLYLARNLTKARVVLLFGCGGDRDEKKRPIMGKIACDLADLVIVTDDNPRFEDAAKIRKGALSGCDASKTIEIANRKEAIKQTIKMLQPDDILILSGKGHEKYQVIGDERLEFDEEKIVKNAIKDAS